MHSVLPLLMQDTRFHFDPYGAMLCRVSCTFRWVQIKPMVSFDQQVSAVLVTSQFLPRANFLL